MKFKIEREALLKPLQMVMGAVEKRPSMLILTHVLLDLEGQTLSVSATDTEVEMVGRVPVADVIEPGKTTVPARKLMEICRALGDNATLELTQTDNKVIVRSGKSRFTLSTLSPDEFPSVEEDEPGQIEFNITQKDLDYLIKSTSFAMAQQDVRYYLNGLLLQVGDKQLVTVATDGHRLSYAELSHELSTDRHQIILPRKAIQDLSHLLDDDEDTIQVTISANHCRLSAKAFTFVTKLIDGRFPEYSRVVPNDCLHEFSMDRNTLKSALTRVSVLSNEKYRGIRLQLRSGTMQILARNPEQEEAQEELDVGYQGDELDLGFNVNYLLDVLNHIDDDTVVMKFSQSNHSLLIESSDNKDIFHVVMPMRL
jgi:DNA polymerase III subunit beta